MNKTKLPTEAQVKNLHKKYAKTDADFALIYTHCQVVDAIAAQLLDTKPNSRVDSNLLHVACMLHDIGAYDVLENGKFVDGVRHGVIGEKILRNEGFPRQIWRFASHHTSVGLTKQDVINQNLSIPPADYTANTPEERLLMYADKFHSKSKPPKEPPYFCTFEWYYNLVQKFGIDKQAKFQALADEFGKPDIALVAGKFGFSIKDVN